MSKLTALLIGSGDSFLLEDGNQKYLIDSGGSQQRILSLIPKRINLAICTHNDFDHANGFIGILKSAKYEIDEIWLPGIWTTVIDFIKSNNFNYTISTEKLNEVNIENVKGILQDSQMEQLLVQSDDDIDEFTDDLGSLSTMIELNYFLRFSVIHNSLSSEIYFNIQRICEIAKLAYEKGVAIKWFFPDDNGDSLINNFKPINSKRLLKMKKIRNNDFNVFFALAMLTSENRHSLVFEYQIDSIPRILFTADSVISIPSPYTEEIIITAPHHGSSSNQEVYTNIKGEHLIWIRSDRPSHSRPCLEFLKLSHKYCLSCTKNFPIRREKICFEFRRGRWDYKKGILCICK